MNNVFVALTRDGDWGTFIHFQGVSTTLEQARHSVSDGSLSGVDKDLGLTASVRLEPTQKSRWESPAVIRQWHCYLRRDDEDEYGEEPYAVIQEIDPSVDWWAGRDWSF